ncbi:MAG: tetratricopeptide repeat protein, partial [Burkholderiales bacterium]
MGLSDALLAQKIRDDGIDILIDLSGHTAHNRLPMFAWKPAPVQVSWLGYFATTGVAAIDYLIADPCSLPEAEEANFTETIWRLPETRLCFTPPDVNVEVSPLPALANGNGHITFGCFNNLGKMNDAVMALWAKLLHAVPQSRLFLKARQLNDAAVRQSVLQGFAVHGIAADRLVLESSSPRAAYLSAYHRVDIALDPFPFPGGATTAEALWMGVPVLTMAGEHFLARQGMSLLSNAGLPEWVAADAADYVARAVSYAGDLQRLAALRKGLRQQVLASPLFDAPRFARHFATALRGMWTEWCNRRNQPRQHTGQVAGDLLTSAVALHKQGKLDQAEALYLDLLKTDPRHADALQYLGMLNAQKGQPDAAIAYFQQALASAPQHFAALSNLGKALQDSGQLDEAVASFRRALQIKSDSAEVYSNLGNALHRLGQFDDALASCRRALEIKPPFAEAHNNLGNVLQDLGRLDEAVASFQHALQINPDYVEAHGNLVFARNYLLNQPADLLLAEARRFGELVTRQASPYDSWRNIPEPGRCLRVGLVSGDFRAHPVGFFIENVLAALASNAAGRVNLIAYSNQIHTDALTERIKANCHGWHAVGRLSDAQLAQRIRDDGIDILIDLSGHTAHNRLPMFAWKPAPVQATWLGYPATTGLAAIDYLIADRWTLPETEEAHFTEKIWRLPESYICLTPPDVEVGVSPLPALGNGYLTFGSFNNLIKMTDAVVALWATVLHAAPQSRLFLKAKQLDQASVRQSVLERFAVHGIAADRLLLEGFGSRLAHFPSYQRVDIALDP